MISYSVDAAGRDDEVGAAPVLVLAFDAEGLWRFFIVALRGVRSGVDSVDRTDSEGGCCARAHCQLGAGDRLGSVWTPMQTRWNRARFH